MKSIGFNFLNSSSVCVFFTLFLMHAIHLVVNPQFIEVETINKYKEIRLLYREGSGKCAQSVEEIKTTSAV